MCFLSIFGMSNWFSRRMKEAVRAGSAVAELMTAGATKFRAKQRKIVVSSSATSSRSRTPSAVAELPSAVAEPCNENFGFSSSLVWLIKRTFRLLVFSVVFHLVFRENSNKNCNLLYYGELIFHLGVSIESTILINLWVQFFLLNCLNVDDSSCS